MSEHGITYTSRDGNTTWELLPLLTRHPRPRDLPRPERDVLASLLRFCLEGIEHLDTRERSSLLDDLAVGPSGDPEETRE